MFFFLSISQSLISSSFFFSCSFYCLYTVFLPFRKSVSSLSQFLSSSFPFFFIVIYHSTSLISFFPILFIFIFLILVSSSSRSLPPSSIFLSLHICNSVFHVVPLFLLSYLPQYPSCSPLSIVFPFPIFHFQLIFHVFNLGLLFSLSMIYFYLSLSTHLHLSLFSLLFNYLLSISHFFISVFFSSIFVYLLFSFPSFSCLLISCF